MRRIVHGAGIATVSGRGSAASRFEFCDLRLMPQRECDLVVAVQEALAAEWIDVERPSVFMSSDRATARVDIPRSWFS
jgi:hypothetical protein